MWGTANFLPDGAGWGFNTDDVGFKMTTKLTRLDIGSNQSKEFCLLGINNGISLASGRIWTFQGTFCVTNLCYTVS